MLPCQCPDCGRWLKFNMSYSFGNPLIYYTCDCGYDSSKQNLTYGTTATYGRDYFKEHSTEPDYNELRKGQSDGKS